MFLKYIYLYRLICLKKVSLWKLYEISKIKYGLYLTNFVGMFQSLRNILHITFYSSVINYYFRRKVVSLSGDLILGGLFPMHEQVNRLDKQLIGLLIILQGISCAFSWIKRFLQLCDQSSFGSRTLDGKMFLESIFDSRNLNLT